LALASAAPGSKIPDESAALLDAVAAVTRVTQNTDVAVAFAQAFAAALGEVVASGATPAQALAAADAALLAEDGRMLGGEASRCSDDAVDAAAAARASARAAVGTARALAADQSPAARTGGGGGGAEEPFLAALLAYAGAPSLGAVPTTPIA
jgi:ADP-ribosylglycohydrolase